MAGVTLTGSGVPVLLSKNIAAFNTAEATAIDYFGMRLNTAFSDLAEGYGYANVYSNTMIAGRTYSYFGNLTVTGSGLLGSVSTIHSVSYNDSQGSFSFSGNLKANAYGFIGGTLSSVEITRGASGVSLSGKIIMDAYGNLSGSVTSYKTVSQGVTLELIGDIPMLGTNGSIKTISISDGANTAAITGNFAYAAFVEATDAITTFSGLFDVASFFNGNDTFHVSYVARDWHGYHGNDTMTGSNGNDRLFGDDGEDILYGMDGADTLDGGAGNDVLYGGSGINTLRGGAGNDVYMIDTLSDTVIEAAGAGHDHVYIRANNPSETAVTIYAADYANVETISIEGTGLYNMIGDGNNNTLIGNGSRNTIYGYGGNDTLIGGAGAQDTLIGGEGDDVYYSANAGDVIIENEDEGVDTIYVLHSHVLSDNLENAVTNSGAAIDLTGNADINTLIGGSGANTLDGGLGADHMIGRGGNDTYIVDDSGDVVIEDAGSGIDTVRSSVSYVLDAHVEHLALTGLDDINAIGNELANSITGNAGNNTLNGGVGIDTLAGGLGDDTYIVKLLANGSAAVKLEDVIAEEINAGVDTLVLQSATLAVSAAATVTLHANFEHLDAAGTGATLLTLKGNAAANNIIGNAGNNTLDGLAGADTLIGGSGNDVYFVDDAGDVVIEQVNGGIDSVRSSVSFHLTQDIEHLTLTGLSAINGFGNALNNTIIGNAANNTLDGGLGVDTLIGGAGNDTYIIDQAGDVIIEAATAGTDTVYSAVSYTLGANLENAVYTGGDNAVLIGNSAVNTLIGNNGHDTLDGGLGADTMIGGMGDDVYYIDHSSDVVIENVNEGIDTVWAKLSYGLIANVENGVLIGAIAANLTGNAGDNTLTGNVANNTIDGGLGADTMIGGKGNDVFIVDHSDDSVIELSGEGIDTVRSSMSYVLSSDIEHLFLTGAAHIDATGNAFANSLTGNSGNNLLEGGAGADILAGGLGNDTYVVNLLASGSKSVVLEDKMLEVANAGIDTLKLLSGTLAIAEGASVTLATHFENLDASGTGATLLTLNGNAVANTLIGNAGDNSIDGFAGADLMIGGAGADIYYLDNISDSVVENLNEGNDTIRITYKNTSAAAIVIDIAAYANIENIAILGTGKFDILGDGNNNILTGNASVNILMSHAGDDTLDGGLGADTMIGGVGDDIYYIDNASDVIIENANEGVDTVWATSSYVLGAYIENASLRGAVTANLTGSADNNTLTGNSANNTIDGGLGADVMAGGKANDVYIVDDSGDNVSEFAGEGIDSVRASISYTLGANIEHLTLLGTADISATGNALANSLIGNAGNNILEGSGGADVLAGGLGNDTYIVNLIASGTRAVVLEDQLTEAANGGTDTLKLISGTLGVTPLATVTLTAHIENLDASDTGVTPLTLKGTAVANTLIGNTGDNTLDGMAGADLMIGGAGNDVYYLDNIDDRVIEDGNAGNDTLRITYKNIATIATVIDIANYANIENVAILGTGKYDIIGDGNDNILTGNASVNVLTGNAGHDTLDGGAGIDTMIGGIGDDVYYIDNAADIIVENFNEGIDTVWAKSSYILAANIENAGLVGTAVANLTGHAGDNTLIGNAGNNTLDGGLGADVMMGGKGNDVYIIDNNADSMTELANEGVDTVRASISYTLGAHVEHLVLTGSADINATGNELANSLTGNAGNNTLNGGAGADILAGGLGNDTYVVNLLASGSKAVKLEDTVTEAANGGTDTLKLVSSTLALTAAATITLAANFENLDASGTGTTNLILKGNAANNIIIGNAGHGTLDGGAGNDTLAGGDGFDYMIGGTGADTFVFDATTTFHSVDMIKDFNLSQGDKIDLGDLLSGYDPLSHHLTDFVRLQIVNGHGVLSVDLDGAGLAHYMTQVVILQGFTSATDINDLLTNSGLIT